MLSFSPKSVRAPTSVHIGAVERIGEAIVNGRFLNAKKVQIHELTTSIDLKKMNLWTANPENGTCKELLFIISGFATEKRINGRKISAPVRFEKNRTGSTALLMSDFFRKIS
jgi:hypothetical protein